MSEEDKKFNNHTVFYAFEMAYQVRGYFYN